MKIYKIKSSPKENITTAIREILDIDPEATIADTFATLIKMGFNTPLSYVKDKRGYVMRERKILASMERK